MHRAPGNAGITIGGAGSTTFDPAQIGALVVHYTYDALGRLIRVQRPEDAGVGTLSVTDLYYDGARVVQEVGWQGVTPRAREGTEGTQPQDRLAVRAIDLSPEDLSVTPPVLPPSWQARRWEDRRLEREYVWAADPGAYIDECLAQACYVDAHDEEAGEEVGNDTSATFLYCLSDNQASVVALTDRAGNLVAQYSYLPYGQALTAEYFLPPGESLASAESLAAARGNRLGHQGLRFERLDAPWEGVHETPLTQGAVIEPGVSGFGGFYHNRNRAYMPHLGRFASNDPNGLGMPVLDDLAFGGRTLGVLDIAPDLMGHYGDGMNAHAAYGSNPLMRRDALGLSTDPFDMLDDFVAEHSASTAAFMEQISGGFSAVSHIVWQVAQMHPAVGMAVSFYRVSKSLASGQMPDLADVIGLLPGGRAGGALFKASQVLGATRAAYAATSITKRLGRIAETLERFLPSNFFRGPKDTYVYLRLDINNKPDYVGITNDINRRSTQHGRELLPITGKLPRLQALAIETSMIIGARAAGYPLQNKILSIAESNPIFKAAIEWVGRGARALVKQDLIPFPW